MKKILVFGGQSSGKSEIAEQKTLKISTNKPYYIATYLDEFDDEDMRLKIEKHQKQREENFINIEEPYDISKVVQDGNTYIVDCLSMLIFNNLDDEKKLFAQLEKISTCKANMVFVLNDVGGGIIASDKQSRKFVELSSKVGQKVASFCDEIYEVKYGLKRRWK
jgi:adenosylcobinamide kinase/adenosylcobinamide-phosphate guanylyltransferase